MKTLTRKNLLETLMRLGLTRVRAGQAVNAFFDSVTQALRDEKKVSIVGFGTWEWKKRRARLARNPKTGKDVQLGTRKTLVFHPSGSFRRKIKKDKRV